MNIYWNYHINNNIEDYSDKSVPTKRNNCHKNKIRIILIVSKRELILFFCHILAKTWVNVGEKRLQIYEYQLMLPNSSLVLPVLYIFWNIYPPPPRVGVAAVA